jgi:hypothetical protein
MILHRAAAGAMISADGAVVVVIVVLTAPE